MLLLSSQLMVYMCALVGFSYLLSVVFLQSAFSRISSTTFIFHLITSSLQLTPSKEKCNCDQQCFLPMHHIWKR